MRRTKSLYALVALQSLMPLVFACTSSAVRAPVDVEPIAIELSAQVTHQSYSNPGVARFRVTNVSGASVVVSSLSVRLLEAKAPITFAETRIGMDTTIPASESRELRVPMVIQRGEPPYEPERSHLVHVLVTVTLRDTSKHEFRVYSPVYVMKLTGR